MMKPLKQWICDSCGELIAKPDDGYLEWIDGDNHRAHSFNIVHHAPRSPRKPDNDCYQHTHHPSRADMQLDNFTGPAGISSLLSFLDAGPLHDPDGENVPGLENLREFTELMRRLAVPYYEEARLYWAAAEADGYFDGANEMWVYRPDKLKTLIDEYGNDR